MSEEADPPSQHYFSRTPLGPAQESVIRVRLAGQEIDVVTADGVFSRDGVDLGTRVLLREVPPPPPRGNLLDLGCGWGPLALVLARLSPGARVWAVDVNERAISLTAANAERLGLANVVACAPEAVPEDVRFAAIWSNPPIRVGKAALHDLLAAWLPRLERGASAHLVVQRHLGADSLHGWLRERCAEGDDVVRAASAKGYRVLRVTHRAGSSPS